MALWFLSLIGTPVSIIALIFIRITLKQGDIDGNYVIPKPFYTGFLGKVIANAIFFSTIVIFMPLINGGPAGFLAVLEWRYIDRSIMANVKYFIWTLNLGLPIIAVGFEAMMFVYASTKDTVLGIDDRLRKTFTNTIFTGVGAISFIAASEIMENLLGFGLVGGVVLGVGLFVGRKPVIGILDRVSNRLIPSEFSAEESEYLKLFSESISDGEITGNERVLLKTLATAYGITDERVEEIEDSFFAQDTEISSENNVAILTEVPQQWTDDSGYSWRKFSDGTIQWWNGTEWQEYM